MIERAGAIKMINGKFGFVGEDGNWYQILLWVHGDRLHISDTACSEEFSIRGELVSLATIPIKGE